MAEALFAHAHATLRVPLENSVALGQGRFGDLADGKAVFPICRADPDETSIAAQTAGKFRETDRDQTTFFRHLIEVGHAFRWV